MEFVIQETPLEGPAKVGYVENGSPAERAGFQPGDLIKVRSRRKYICLISGMSSIASTIQLTGPSTFGWFESLKNGWA